MAKGRSKCTMCFYGEDSDTEEKLQEGKEESKEENRNKQLPKAEVFSGSYRYRYQRDVLGSKMASAGTTQRISSIEVDNPAPKTSDEEDSEPAEVVRKRRFRTPKLKSIRKIFKWRGRKSKSLGETEAEAGVTEPLSKSTSELSNADDDKLNAGSASGMTGLSLSHDSVFNPDQQKPSQQTLQPTTISVENIPSGFSSELSAKLRSRVESCSEDDGLGHTPDVTLTSDVLNERSEPVGDNKRDSGILSMDDEVFITKKLPIARRTKSLSSSPPGGRKRKMYGYKKSKSTANAGDVDFDSVSSSTILTNEGALHRISIAPKARRASSRSRLAAQRSGSRSELPNTPEEIEETEDDAVQKTTTVSSLTVEKIEEKEKKSSMEFSREITIKRESLTKTSTTTKEVVVAPVAEIKELDMLKVEEPDVVEEETTVQSSETVKLAVPDQEEKVVEFKERKISLQESKDEKSTEDKRKSLTEEEKQDVEKSTSLKKPEQRLRSASFEPRELQVKRGSFEIPELRHRSATFERPVNDLSAEQQEKENQNKYTVETSRLVTVVERKLKIERIEPQKQQTREVIIVSPSSEVAGEDDTSEETKKKREGFRASKKKAIEPTETENKENKEEKVATSMPRIILPTQKESDKARIKIRTFSEREKDPAHLKIRTFSERRASEETANGVPMWVAMAKQRRQEREDKEEKETETETEVKEDTESKTEQTKETEKSQTEQMKENEKESDESKDKAKPMGSISDRLHSFKSESSQEQQKNELNKKPSSNSRKTFVAPKTEKCIICGNRVYIAEMAKSDGKVFHKSCQKCKVCNRTLMIGNLMLVQDLIYCRLHGSEVKAKQIDV
ncbi:centrosomal protein of 83 kDa-like isoform X3 [Ptychodera flava]|uniref:centrosomal protein of 83 kDa-like isoform X3 n=1 Tax=Ptychodera flava TaxID=63121 RepID=UPI003969F753